MDKTGSLLQEQRLRKGLTLERIADDTNIGVRFLSKLENDDYTGFPGEPYIIGFLRNYAEYLGLDAELVLSAYRGRNDPPAALERVGAEVESPIEEAIAQEAPARSPEPKKEQEVPAVSPRRRIPLAAVFAGIIVIGALLWIVLGGMFGSAKEDLPEKTPMVYRVEGGPFEKRLYVGDSLLIPLGEEMYKFTVLGIQDTVTLETPFGELLLSLSAVENIDPDNNGLDAASLSVVDFEKNREDLGVLLVVEFPPDSITASEPGVITIPEKSPAAPPIQAVAPEKSTDTVLFSSTRGTYPFSIQVTFRGNCLFRHEADKKEWVEKYYLKGETLSINVNSSLTVWTSNAQAVKMTFMAAGGKPVDLELGAPGEIAVKRIAWNHTETSWSLVASTLD